MRVVAVLRRLAHVHLADAESLPLASTGGTVLVAVELDLLEHLAPHGARAAAEVVEPRAGDAADQAMEGRAAQRSNAPPARGQRRPTAMSAAQRATSLRISAASIWW